MAPLVEPSVDTSREADDIKPQKESYPFEPHWHHIIVMLSIHVMGLYGLVFLTKAKLATLVFAALLHVVGAIGITAGAHRLWAHRSYKATLPLRLLLVSFQSMTPQNSVIWWCLTHRRHHKNSDTDADPHNIHRGFFFAHLGWLLLKKHPDVTLKGRTVDVSDLWNDPVLAFQNRHYAAMVLVFCFAIPTVIPWYFWDEAILNAFFVAGNLRLLITFHAACLVNSAAHTFGYKPYDRSIPPGDVWSLSYLTLGESWHNYHHSFPWDYKASEYGRYSTNLAAAFIDLMARIGWAYDLRSASPAVIESRMNKSGDVALRRRY